MGVSAFDTVLLSSWLNGRLVLVTFPLLIGGVAHGFIAGLPALLSWPDRAAVRGACSTRLLWGRLVCILSRLTAVGLSALLIMKLLGPGQDLGQSFLPRPPVHGREWAPHTVDGRGQMVVEPSRRPALQYRPCGPRLQVHAFALLCIPRRHHLRNVAR